MTVLLNPILMLSKFEEMILNVSLLFTYLATTVLHTANAFPVAMFLYSEQIFCGQNCNQCQNKESSTLAAPENLAVLPSPHRFGHKAALKTRKQRRKQHLFEGVWKKSISFKEILINSVL